MKLIDYCYYQDFGHEWYLQVLSCYPKFTLVDLCVQWDDYPATEWFPFLVIGIGPYDVGFTFRWKWFELRCDFFDFQPRNLEAYRRCKEEYVN
jgi:hypothetical protein